MTIANLGERSAALGLALLLALGGIWLYHEDEARRKSIEAQQRRTWWTEAQQRRTWWTWHATDAADATCVLSELTPEQWVSWADSSEGHALGLSAQPIAPDDVFKNGGDIAVFIHAKFNGEDKGAAFFTSKDLCDKTASGFKPEQAPSGDIN